MTVLLTLLAREDLRHWDKSDQRIAQKVRRVLRDLEQGKTCSKQQMICLTFRNIFLTSIKITQEHRLIFEVVGSEIIVHQCRLHY